LETSIMAPVDIRPPGYIPQGTFSGTIPGEKGIERRRRLADVLAARGTETTPVQHWTQGAARIANSLAGALGDYQAGQMEQQRYKALGEAMRSGMTPEQLYGTGDESLMNYAKFKLQMDQQKTEADRQAEMLRLAQNQDVRESAAAEAKTQPQYRVPTADEKEIYGPDLAYMDPIQGPQFHSSQVNKPDPIRTITDEFGNQRLVRVGDDNSITELTPPPTAAAADPNRALPTPLKMTEGQEKSLLYYRNGRLANKNLTRTETALKSSRQAVAGRIPWIRNYLTSPDYQEARQAAAAFLNAVKRKESGMQITEAEWSRAFDEYLPVPGEPDSVTAQKRSARANALASVKMTAGHASRVLDREDQAYSEAQTAIDAAPPERKEEARQRVMQRLLENGFEPEGF
jgi:hypothetical protein